ncbi:MAG: hypothetical protein H7A51_19625 [Akkermansiaceae bacterium]|nr:hypothetical protein [Akkermansiaceae bacterium]
MENESTKTTEDQGLQATEGQSTDSKGGRVVVNAGVEPEPHSVGERMVLMMVERRSGLPIREHITLCGMEPYLLMDSITPVIAVRGKKGKHQKTVAAEVFNAVLPWGLLDKRLRVAATPVEMAGQSRRQLKKRPTPAGAGAGF